MSRRFAVRPSSARSRALDRDVFVGPGIGEIRDQAEPGLADPGPAPLIKASCQIGAKTDFSCTSCCICSRIAARSLMVELGGLLRRQCVDVGIAAIDVGAAFDDEGVEAGRGIAKGAGAALDEVLEFLVAAALRRNAARSIGRSLRADADLLRGC